MIRIGDVDFTLDMVKENREAVIGFRDAALQAGQFEWAIVLSYTVALLAELIKREELTP